MVFPLIRHRRLRRSVAIREMVQETWLQTADLVAPLFVVPGSAISKAIPSLPGQFWLSPDKAVDEAEKLYQLGICAVILFGLPAEKDESGSTTCRDDGLIQQTIGIIKKRVPQLLVIADLCFCEYTTHGHCGILVGEDVDNDLTLEQLSRQGLSLAQSGADILAPSGMIDGMVITLRESLDQSGFSKTLILSYSAKYASSFYGPFREAADCAPTFGDRRSYQMNPANSDEAMREIEADIHEGADIVMVKPALAYLDIIQRARQSFNVPLAAYNVSGEYVMVKAAAEKKLINEQQVIMEMLQSIKRAGASIIITYFAKEAALLLQNK